MDTKLLEVFLAVVHAGSISGAARRLDFSQPAVSQQIKALEKVMETELFSREGGRIHLTPAGRRCRATPSRRSAPGDSSASRYAASPTGGKC